MSCRRAWRNFIEGIANCCEAARNLYLWAGELREEYLQPSRFFRTRSRWIAFNVVEGLVGVTLIASGIAGTYLEIYVLQDVGYTTGSIILAVSVYGLVWVPYESAGRHGELVASFRRVFRVPSSSDVNWSNNENFVEFPESQEELEPLMYHDHQAQLSPEPRTRDISRLQVSRRVPISRGVERNPSCRSPECTPKRRHPSAPGDIEASRHGAEARAREAARARAAAAAEEGDEMLEIRENGYANIEFDLPRPRRTYVAINIDDIIQQPPGSADFPTSTPSTSQDELILLYQPRRPAPPHFLRHDTSCPAVRRFTRQFNYLLRQGNLAFADYVLRDVPFPFRTMSMPSLPFPSNGRVRLWWNTVIRTFSRQSMDDPE